MCPSSRVPCSVPIFDPQPFFWGYFEKHDHRLRRKIGVGPPGPGQLDRSGEHPALDLGVSFFEGILSGLGLRGNQKERHTKWGRVPKKKSSIRGAKHWNIWGGGAVFPYFVTYPFLGCSTYSGASAGGNSGQRGRKSLPMFGQSTRKCLAGLLVCGYLEGVF